LKDNLVEAFRKVTDLERYLETDFHLVKGIIEASRSEIDEKILSDFISIMHFYICGEPS
jgi:hypothetical protein